MSWLIPADLRGTHIQFHRSCSGNRTGQPTSCKPAVELAAVLIELSGIVGTTFFWSLLRVGFFQLYGRGSRAELSGTDLTNVEINTSMKTSRSLNLAKLETTHNTSNPRRALIILAAASRDLHLRGSMTAVGLFGDALLNHRTFYGELCRERLRRLQGVFLVVEA